MIRGQSEYIGVVILITLTILMVLLASEWLYAIARTGRESVEMIYRAREDVDIRSVEEDVIVALNKGYNEVTINSMLVQLSNGTIMLRKTSLNLKPGEEKRITLDTTNVKRVCVETVNRNIFCSASTRKDVYSDEENSVEKTAISISRLYPLLAKVLTPSDYDSITKEYIPLGFAIFKLDRELRLSPFAKVELYWNASNWIAVYKKNDGRILGVATAPISSDSIPYRELLYHSKCDVKNNISYCFEVYLTVAGYRYTSYWYFDLGMKIVYKFEPLNKDLYVLVALNRSTYDIIFNRKPITCWYDEGYYLGYYYYRCSDKPDIGYPAGTLQELANYINTPRPLFLWRIDTNDKKLGSFYPYVSSSTTWSSSTEYSYSLGKTVKIELYIRGLRFHDYKYHYLFQAPGTEDHVHGYYYLAYSLVFDKDGFSSSLWSYDVAAFLMRNT